MSSVNSLSGADALAKYRVENQDKPVKDKNELGKNEFMKLMIAQLENQSPLDPQDNGAFISQLAEFSALDEMQKLGQTVTNFAGQYRSTQALQASAMVGRSVMVPATESPLNSQGMIQGMVQVPSYTRQLNISILNASGELVNTYSLGSQASGSVPFVWDGRNSLGQDMPFDDYTIKAEAVVDGKSKQLTTLIAANVNSVSIGQNGKITLNLSGMGKVPLEQVQEII